VTGHQRVSQLREELRPPLSAVGRAHLSARAVCTPAGRLLSYCCACPHVIGTVAILCVSVASASTLRTVNVPACQSTSLRRARWSWIQPNGHG